MATPQWLYVTKGSRRVMISGWSWENKAKKDGWVIDSEVFVTSGGKLEERPITSAPSQLASSFVPPELANLRKDKAATLSASPSEVKVPATVVDPNATPVIIPAAENAATTAAVVTQGNQSADVKPPAPGKSKSKAGKK